MKWKLFSEYLLNKEIIKNRIVNGIRKFHRIKRAFRKLIELFRNYKAKKANGMIPSLDHLK